MAFGKAHAGPVCVIIGAGEGTGAALAQKFAGEGYSVALIARNRARLDLMTSAINGTTAFVADVTNDEQAKQALSEVRTQLGQIAVVIYNIGKIARGDVLSMDASGFEAVWRQNVLGAYLCAQHVLPDMLDVKKGVFVFLGATASKRASAQNSAFSAAKAGQRALAMSMAKAYGPLGVHVAHIVIDSVVDQRRTRERLRNRPENEFCSPAAIAESTFHIVQQPASTWTFELDIRPSSEQW